MPEAWRFPSDSPTRIAKLRVARRASQQFGLIARHQLQALGVANGIVAGWIAGGYLFRRLPGVYAVGHVPSSVQAELTAALLWAGPGAMLSHATGAWWLGLAKHRPDTIHVCTPRRRKSRPGITVHGRSPLKRHWYRELPTPLVPELLLQFATTATHNQLRKALAQTEYERLAELREILAECQRGRAGSTALKAALAHHLPQLAVTDSELEDRMLFLCETYGLPIPECNVYIEGFKVDAIWREQKVIVEVDGRDGHASWERIRRDRRRDLTHRRAGFTTLRYVWEQLVNGGELVAADVLAALG